MHYSRQPTRCFLVKTIFTDEHGEQSTDHRLYEVLRDKTDETFRKEMADYLTLKYPKLLFSVSLYDWGKPLPAEALPEDVTELSLFPW